MRGIFFIFFDWTQYQHHRKSFPTPLAAVVHLMATGFGLGYARKAPGTFGSLLGLPLGLLWLKGGELFQYSPEQWLFNGFLLVCFTSVSFYAIRFVERTLKIHDEPCIVIDEVLGQAIAIAMIGSQIHHLVLGFVLFRFFDILKPGPIGYCDQKLPGAWGTLLDDVLAGLFSGLLAYGVLLVF